MSSEIALQVNNLSKCYAIYQHPRDRLLQVFWGQRKRLYQPFWAVRDVSFELRRGKTLGIMGRNGSGKSTLLQMVCNTVTPTAGSVKAHGRTAALLELGSGFNPEFNGLENVYLNGALLGLKRREIDDVLDEILNFADIGEFIHQPVKTYSSGMAIRLAFAVQAHVKPNLLIVDEALAVGDEIFQKKCYAHIEKLKQAGTAILLVTHSCQQILQHCDEALLLHRGQLKLMDTPKVVTHFYQRLCNAPAHQWDDLFHQLTHEDGHSPQQAEPTTTPRAVSSQIHEQTTSPAWSYEAHGIEIQGVEVLSTEGEITTTLDTKQPFSVRFHYQATAKVNDLQVGCNIATQNGVRVTGQFHPGPDCDDQMVFSLTFHFKAGLMPGLYFIGGGVWQSSKPGTFLHRVVDACTLRITSGELSNSFGFCDLTAAPPTLN